MPPVISGILLAAGSSFRMGSPKALLKIKDKTFVEHLAGILRAGGIEDVVIVLGADADLIRPSLGWFSGTVVVNADWEQGQLTSIIAGLQAASNPAGAMICPVDHPLITTPLVADLCKVFENDPEK